jgi:hypothetical protein
MYLEIAAAIQSARSLAELVKATHSLSNYNELVAAVSEVNAKLMDATAVALASQEKQAALASRVSELENELMKFKDTQCRIDRYALHELPTGQLVYALKPGMEQGEPMHYACTACVDKGVISKLQPVHAKRRLWCAQCKTTFVMEHDPPSNSNSTPSIRRSEYMAKRYP